MTDRPLPSPDEADNGAVSPSPGDPPTSATPQGAGRGGFGRWPLERQGAGRGPEGQSTDPAARQASLRRLLDPADGLGGTELPLPGHSEWPPEWPAAELAPELPDLERQHTRDRGVTGVWPDASLLTLTTLDESVVEALIQALYDALPGELAAEAVVVSPERTSSGNVLGRPQGSDPVPLAQDTPDPTLPDEDDPERLPAPRTYVRGLPDDETLEVARQSLPDLELAPPSVSPATLLRASAVLGQGEACFLRAQSALWAWRTHRQSHLELHTDGPPGQGRHVLIEQRVGPLTLLISARVTRMVEGERYWGFTLTTLEHQVVRAQESFLVEWLEDDGVVFTFESRVQLAAPNLVFLSPALSALRRVWNQGYLRNMREMTADAD